jgi:hypothetical protein
MWKKPTEFSKLGKVEWRRLEQPTFPLRMRALCNQLKSVLIQSAHDPAAIQTQQLLHKDLAPVKDEDTWKKWWNGERVPQSEQVSACVDIVKESRYWLEHSEFGNPIQRHMLALDAMGIELTRDGEWWEKKFDVQDRCLVSQKRVWSRFTKSSCESTDSPLSFEKQLLGTELPCPSLAHATEDEKLRTEIFGINPYIYEFSESTRKQYVDSEKFGLFQFFERVLYETRLQQPWLRDIWILDMASLIALMRTDLVPTPEHEAPGLGHHTEQFAFWNRLFWDHFDGTITPLIRFARSQDSDSRKEMLELVLAIRKRYYELLAQLGVSFEDVYQIAAPVVVLGARKITDNIIYE